MHDPNGDDVVVFRIKTGKAAGNNSAFPSALPRRGWV